VDLTVLVGPAESHAEVSTEGGTVANVLQTQVRCAGCHRRLADLVNEIEAGQLILELKCPRCGQPHLEVIRRPESDR
jgi:Zn finger protein HypA/HybF involved in hydrogenase expression